jgi:decaprenylphospho-beta-D-ribofuranose 2-oxidase
MFRETTLHGWGRALAGRSLAARPERIAEARAALAASVANGRGHGVIARGAGRSYGDAAVNEGGRVILTGRLDRILAFDPERLEVTVEPGVTFETLMRVFLPRGLMVPVTPGTAFATIGGAIANDVHGKNHETAGSFGDHLRWADLLLPDGSVVRASPQERPDLFAATVGGLGLTGVILGACFALTPVPSDSVELTEARVADLSGFLAAFAERRATYSVGWIDCLARGGALGRGILETAEPAAESAGAARPRRTARVPLDAPGWLLNGATVAAFNAAYWRRVPAAGRRRRVDYGRFLYPLDALHDWNRIYGRRGFAQFQCVVPPEEGERALRRLLEAVAASRGASFLAVIKAMGGEGKGLLSFPMRGYTLALDVPMRDGTAALMRGLEAITLDHGGRIYLAKDSFLSPEGFARMYPAAPRFRNIVAGVDPDGRLQSSLSRRIGLWPSAAGAAPTAAP